MSQKIKVANLQDIPPGSAKVVEVDEEDVAIFNINGEIYAIDDLCSHAEASLAQGFIDGHTVMCPLHGAKFDLKTGKNLSLPAVTPVESYKTEVENDEIFVILED